MLSFQLSDSFISDYEGMKPPWGFEVAEGVSLGELTFLRTYSRVKPDGSKETWLDVCRRVTEGTFSIIKDHCAKTGRWFDEPHQSKTAEEFFDSLFMLKWSPPGRGLWSMGTPLVHEQGEAGALQNCAFVSTDDFDTDPAEPFTTLMLMSMLGIGVGLDTDMRYSDITIHRPKPMEADHTDWYTIPDSREGWVESVGMLLRSYMLPGRKPVGFDYSQIRPAGAPIKGFGGVAAGPEPLQQLHAKLRSLFHWREGEKVDTVLIADIANLIGRCVVSGNVRRSAEIILGESKDNDFINLKNQEAFPERNSFDPENPGWAWMSNNTIKVHTGFDYSSVVERIAENGEPGLMWLDVVRQNARVGDPNDEDAGVEGVNPCAEIFLESNELCTLSEMYLPRHKNLEELINTAYYAYLYGKAVTLLELPWAKSAEVMNRNRRVGLSMSGVSEFADGASLTVLSEWMNTVYERVQSYDITLSEWLDVPRSKRTTTIKPSGTVSLLAGVTPGVHWSPGGRHYLRAIRFAANDPLVAVLQGAGYMVEQDVMLPDTKVIYFPVKSSQYRSEKDVSLWEKAQLAALAQEHWADNGVSCTLSFDPETETEALEPVLTEFDGQFKAVSFLPMSNDTYPQMPYSSISAEQWSQERSRLYPVSLASVYAGQALDAAGEVGCTTDVCEIKTFS